MRTADELEAVEVDDRARSVTSCSQLAGGDLGAPHPARPGSAAGTGPFSRPLVTTASPSATLVSTLIRSSGSRSRRPAPVTTPMSPEPARRTPTLDAGSVSEQHRGPVLGDLGDPPDQAGRR